MILFKEFLEICDYKVSGGSEFCWKCFGPNAYTFDAGDFEHENTYSFQITFDTKNQIAYCAEMCDYKNNRAYRMFNPFYEKKYYAEAEQRGVNDQAWDEVKFVDIDLDEDFVEKCKAIIAGEPYSTKISVPLDITYEELHELMVVAHQKDITLNDLVTDILEMYITQSKIV